MKFKSIPPELSMVLLGSYKDADADQIKATLVEKGFDVSIGPDGKVKFKTPRLGAFVQGKRYEFIWDKLPQDINPWQFILAFVYGTKYVQPAPRAGGTKRGYDLGRSFLKNPKQLPEFMREIKFKKEE
jgi:hypothetical protein